MSRLSEEEKARRINAEVRLLTRLSRCGSDALNCTCPLCAGIVSMHVVRRDAKGLVAQSRGECSTPTCLEWNQ